MIQKNNVRKKLSREIDKICNMTMEVLEKVRPNNQSPSATVIVFGGIKISVKKNYSEIVYENFEKLL